MTVESDRSRAANVGGHLDGSGVTLSNGTTSFRQTVTSIEQGIAACSGNLAGFTCENKFGHNQSVGTSQEDIWDEGGSYPWPVAASPVTVSSTNVNDSSVGSGARTVEIIGLDADYIEINEVVSMNGQTPVVSVNSYLRVFRCIVRTAGSSGFNEGQVYIGTGVVTAGVPAVVLAKIIFDETFNGSFGENQTLMATYTVPAGKTAYISSYFVGTSSNKLVEYWMYLRPLGEVFQVKHRSMITQGTYLNLFSQTVVAVEKTDIKLTAAVNVGTTDISAGFSLTLIVDN